MNVKLAGFYDSQEDITVTDKNSTAHVINLDAINVDELSIEGIAKNKTTGAAITGAEVDLEQKVNGEWKVVGTVTTASSGEYAFLNSTAVTTLAIEYEFKDVYGDRTNVITTSGEYRIVANKEVLGDVYHEVTSNVTVSTKAPETYAPVSLVPVKEIAKLDLSYSFNPNILVANTVDTSDNKVKDVNITLIDANGTDEKLDVASAVGLSVEKDSVSGIYSGKVNLVDLIKTENSAAKVQLKSGNYFLKLDDGKNAIQVIAFKVVEGENGAYSIQAKAPQDLTVSSAFETFPVDTTDAVDAVLADKSNLKVYETINGVKVLIESNTIDYTFNDGTPNKLDVVETVQRLAAQGYTVMVDGDYILGSPEKTVTVAADSVSQVNVSVKGAGLFETDLTLKDNAGDPISLTKTTSHEVKATVKDSNGKVVETHDLSFVVKTDGTFEQIDETDVEVELVESGSVVTTNTAATDTLRVTIPKLKPGKYTVEFSSDNFKTATTSQETVAMFDKAEDVVDFIATPTAIVGGSLNFGNLTDATATKILVFDEKGTNVTTKVNVQTPVGSYKIDLQALAAGKYKLVFYGANFETVEKIVTVAKGLNTENVTVVKGGQSQYDLNIFDENGARLTATDVTVTAKDAYGENVVFAAALTNGKISTTDTLSKGDIKLTVKQTTGTDTYITVSETLTVDRINGTFLRTIDVPLVDNGKTFKVSGVVSNDTTNDPLIDLTDAIVIVKDAETGEFVKTAAVAEDGKFDTLLSNGSYVISIFEDGSYVPARTIQVKDSEVSNVNFVLTDATR